MSGSLSVSEAKSQMASVDRKLDCGTSGNGGEGLKLKEVKGGKGKSKK